MNLFPFRPNLTSNTSLALASFFIAFAIWTIAKEGELTEQDLSVPVNFEAPPYAELSASPKSVSLTLRFPVSQSNLLDRRKVWIDLGKHPGGDPRTWAGLDEAQSRVVNIEPRNAVLSNLPRTFQVIEVQPTSIMVSGKLHNREARVEPLITGKPNEGFVASSPQTEPPTLTLIGAPGDLEKLQTNDNDEIVVTTAAIDIEGQTEYFETRTEVILPQGVELAEGQTRRVRVVVPIKEEVGSRIITGIPVEVPTYSMDVRPSITPETASVRVEGPLSLINGLSPKDLLILPKEAIEETVGTEATVSLDVQFGEDISQPVREKVTIVNESLSPKMALLRMEDIAPATSPNP